MADTGERYRLLVLGSGQVGKTSIIKRYLYGTFSDRYKETVEDIFSRDFHIHGASLPLDIYDTNFYYPDMRRVSITSANAFLLVFAVDNVNSFKDVTELVQEVADRRQAELADLPLILVGNKSDASTKKIYPETVEVWLKRLTFKKFIPYVECSAKDNENVVAIFKSLLDQSGFPNRMSDTLLPGHKGVSPRRRSPCSQLALSPNRQSKKPPQLDIGATDDVGQEPDADQPKSPTTLNEQRISRLTRTLSRKEKPVTAATLATNGITGLTRHGSLMRKTQRMSLKIKHSAPSEPDESDCRIS